MVGPVGFMGGRALGLRTLGFRLLGLRASAKKFEGSGFGLLGEEGTRYCLSFLDVDSMGLASSAPVVFRLFAFACMAGSISALKFCMLCQCLT